MAAQKFLKRHRSWHAAVPLATALALLAGCAGTASRVAAVRGGPLRISEVAGAGDPTRRASTRLVANGLAADDPQRALSQFERAIKIDATNPYAYLALASYEIQWGDVERGVQSLSQAELLLDSERRNSPRVAPHLAGLRGRAQMRFADDRSATNGHGDVSKGKSLLKRAGLLAPDVWGDGWLSARELQ